MTIEVRGLKENLRLLNELNPKLRREFGKRFRDIAKPGAKAAQQLRDQSRDVRGFDHAGRTGLSSMKAIGVKVDTRRGRRQAGGQRANFETTGVVKILTKDATSAIMDMAGRAGGIQRGARSRPYAGRPQGHALNGQGAHMVKKLNDSFGSPASRFMWRGAEQGMGEMDNVLRDMVADVSRELQRELTGSI